MVSEKEILTIKNEAVALRDKTIEAKATFAEVEKNINTYKKELEELGVDPETADKTILDIGKKIEEYCDKASEKIKEWNK